MVVRLADFKHQPKNNARALLKDQNEKSLGQLLLEEIEEQKKQLTEEEAVKLFEKSHTNEEAAINKNSSTEAASSIMDLSTQAGSQLDEVGDMIDHARELSLGISTELTECLEVARDTLNCAKLYVM